MPRPSKLWKRAGRDDWHATIGGRKVNLGPDREAAQREFHRLKAARMPVHASRMLVVQLVDSYLCAVHSDVQASTFANYRWYLQQWVNFAGHRPAAGVKPLDVTAWFRSRGQWNPTTRRLAAELVRRWSRWAKAQGYLDVDVLAGLRAPKTIPRTAARSEDIQNFLQAVTCPLLRDIAIVLLDTGARPGEIRTLEADQVSWTDSTAIVNGKTGPRVISLTSRSLATLANLATLYPTGPLFRNRAGRIWTRGQLAWRFRALSKKLGICVYPYHLRHDLYRRASKAGVPDLWIAKQLGHVDLKMLSSRYAHVDTEQTRQAVEKASQPGPTLKAPS